MTERSRMRTSGTLVTALLAACLLQDCAQAQSADGFRIETDVMLQNQAKPFLQTVTIFLGGVAYDYCRSEPHRVTVFQLSENRIDFLDQEREIQTRVNLQELQAFMERARAELANSSMAAALQDAQLVEVNEAAHRVIVGKQFVRYEANYQVIQSEAIAKLYSDFANASASINSWQAPDRNPPSFARVRFNQALSERQAIPTEITRTTFSSDGSQHVLKSRLHVSWQLSDEDHSSVKKFETMMKVFGREEVGEFMSPNRISSKTGSARTVQR